MTICDHQFHGSDGSDWVLSTSVGCLDGSATASRILQELFRKHYRNLTGEDSRKRPKTVAPENVQFSKHQRDTKTRSHSTRSEHEETLIVRKIPAVESFDESQHLSGCPMKWLYDKRLLERNRKLRAERLCCKRSPRKEEVKRERPGNLRDRTPVEVKIHKINLTEKYTINSDDVRPQPKDLDARRRKLAAKLNWKLHDDSQDDQPLETSSERGARHDYFPPRPLLGLKPLLSVLLAPHRSNCCCWVTQLRGVPPGKGRGASLSIQSLDLPSPQGEPQPRPKTTNSLRWGSKSRVLTKKLQVPHQITIKLEQKKQKCGAKGGGNPGGGRCNPPVRRRGEGRKQEQSLSSLFYELRGKTSDRVVRAEEVLEEMIRDLRAGGVREGWVEVGGWGGKERSRRKAEMGVMANDSNLVCEKARFFRKPRPK